MSRYRHSATGFCLILVMTCALVPQRTRAENRRVGALFRMPVAAFVPIGSVYSLGQLSINGRRVHGEQVIWGGELLQVSEGASACVVIDSIGQIRLKNEAMAILATGFSGSGDNGARIMLVASLVRGDITVRLQPDAKAYLEICGSAFTASIGAYFSIRVREGRALVDRMKGAVWIQDEPPTIKAASVQVQPNGNITELPPNTPVDAKRGETKPVSAQVKRHQRIRRVISFASTAASSQVPSQEVVEPVAFRKVHFKVDTLTGTIESEGTTDKNGVVTVNFTAAPKARGGTITGIIEPDPAQDGSNASYEDFHRGVKIKLGFVSHWGKYIIPAAVGVVIEEILRRRKGPIKQEPPPTIP